MNTPTDAPWSAEQVTALAPDAQVSKAGLKLAAPGTWSRPGTDGTLLWGAARGSGKNPYKVCVDLTGPAFTCSCPSRKIPCKHTFGLLHLWSQGQVPSGEPSDYAADWAQARRKRAERKAARAASTAPDADPATVKRSQAGMAKWRNRAGRLGQRTRSVKADVLLEQLEPVVAEGHKALVFSQFTRYLRSVEEDLRWAGLRTAYLDGTTTNRQEVIDSFRSGRADVFLISLKAGGFGLTLTEADYVFLLDPWWNPQAEAQAVDRAHRIGQDKPVMVYRLVAAGTIEEKIMELKATKAALFTEVVEGGADEALAAEAGGRARLTVRDIRELMED